MTPAEKRKATYWARKAAGECVKCGSIAIEGKTMCGRCAESNVESVAKAHRKYGLEGRCHRCGCDLVNKDRYRCPECRAHDTAYKRNRRKAMPEAA